MYEAIPQDQDSIRDLYELGLLPEPTLVMTDAEAEQAQAELAMALGWDAFSGTTPTEFLASRDALATA